MTPARLLAPRLILGALLPAALLLTGCSRTMEEGAAAEQGMAAEDGGEFAGARALFERFVELGNDYDSGIAGLYAENAKILLIQEKRDGEVRKVSVSGTDFKALVPRILPRAEEAGEQNTYSDVTYAAEEDGRVRIEAERTATPHGFTVPHVLVVGPAPEGDDWLIYEEIAVTPQ